MAKDQEETRVAATRPGGVTGRCNTPGSAIMKEILAMSSAKSVKSKGLVSSEGEDRGDESEPESASSSSDSESSASDSYSNSDSASDSGSFSGSDSPTRSSKSSKNRNPAPPSTTSQSLPQTYSLPPNSTPLPVTTLTSTNPFLPSNLSGKQLFSITAPSHIPLSALANLRLPLSSLTTGDPFFTHASHRYGLRSDEDDLSSSTGLSLLTPLPTTTDGSYGVSTVRITKSLHLIISPPVPAAALARNTIQPKPARAQPEGLQMRYRPFGAGPSLPAESHFGGADREGEVGQVIREVHGSGHGDVGIGGTGDGDPSRKRRKTGAEEGKRKKQDRGKKQEKRPRADS